MRPFFIFKIVNLTDEQIQKYQLMHKKRFGVDISAEEAFEQGMNLVCFVEFLCGSTREETGSNDGKKKKRN